MNLHGWLETSLDYAEYCIHSEFDKGNKQNNKPKKYKQDLSEQYLLAYNQQSNIEKL
jgi:hypothetical protein